MEDLVGFFKVLSDQTRFDILSLLLSREMCVCELVDQLKLSQSLISHHLYHLKVTGLVRMRREGTWIFYSVDEESLNQYKLKFLKELEKASQAKIPCKFDCCKVKPEKSPILPPVTKKNQSTAEEAAINT